MCTTVALQMPKRILVVDDYADSREILNLILRQAGFLVFVAVNGVEHSPQPSIIALTRW